MQLGYRCQDCVINLWPFPIIHLAIVLQPHQLLISHTPSYRMLARCLCSGVSHIDPEDNTISQLSAAVRFTRWLPSFVTREAAGWQNLAIVTAPLQLWLSRLVIGCTQATGWLYLFARTTTEFQRKSRRQIGLSDRLDFKGLVIVALLNQVETVAFNLDLHVRL